MKKIIVSLFFILCLFPFGTVSAESTCECWCGAEGIGSAPAGEKTRSECITDCNAGDSEFVGCITEDQDRPTADLTCWTQDECSVIDTDGNRKGIWGETVPADCPSTSVTGSDELRYCYAPPPEVELGVNIYGVSTVSDVGVYINLIYAWLWYAGMVSAIIMIMVGGFEYMIGAGIDKIQNAKRRIWQAIIGFILLLMIQFILSFVNPALIDISIPGIPMTKQVALLDPESTCEFIIGLGYPVKVNGTEYGLAHLGALKNTTTCGWEGEVQPNAAGTEPTLETCYFSNCSSDSEGCLNTKDITKPPKCLACEDIGPGGDPMAPTPSAETCKSIGYNNSGDTKRFCRFTKDSTLVPSGQAITVKTSGTCAKFTVNCGGISACMQYDHVKVVSTGGNTENLECITGSIYGAFDATLMATLCREDLCGVAPAGETCAFVQEVRSWPATGAASWDCRNSGWENVNPGPLNLLDIGQGLLCRDKNGSLLIGQAFCTAYHNSDILCPIKL